MQGVILVGLLNFLAQVHIENGELIMGIICKKTVGAAGGGLMHICQVRNNTIEIILFLTFNNISLSA